MFVGRKEEVKLLNEALVSHRAEMVAILGRRRVGKTFLVRSVYRDQIIFEQTGIRNASQDEQLRTFTNTLRKLSPQPLRPNLRTGWMPFLC